MYNAKSSLKTYSESMMFDLLFYPSALVYFILSATYIFFTFRFDFKVRKSITDGQTFI